MYNIIYYILFMIPLNILTFYHNLKNIPENMKKNYEKMKSNNPEFHFEIFDNESGYKFINENFDNLPLK